MACMGKARSRWRSRSTSVSSTLAARAPKCTSWLTPRVERIGDQLLPWSLLSSRTNR
jgi:hypothetical protein